jgi:toxin ParE1/3/4
LPECKFSKRALADLKSISRYTLETWGEVQSLRYVDDLQDFLKQLAWSPMLGRSCESIQTGLRRLEHKSHIIFYRKTKDGIFVSRILHQRMLPEKHLLD